MHRIPRPDDPRLEALLDDRDQLKIQISLLCDARRPEDGAKRDVLQRELQALEKLIAVFK